MKRLLARPVAAIVAKRSMQQCHWWKKFCVSSCLKTCLIVKTSIEVLMVVNLCVWQSWPVLIAAGQDETIHVTAGHHQHKDVKDLKKINEKVSLKAHGNIQKMMVAVLETTATWTPMPWVGVGEWTCFRLRLRHTHMIENEWKNLVFCKNGLWSTWFSCPP